MASLFSIPHFHMKMLHHRSVCFFFLLLQSFSLHFSLVTHIYLEENNSSGSQKMKKEFWKKAQLLLITAIISSLLFTPKMETSSRRSMSWSFPATAAAGITFIFQNSRQKENGKRWTNETNFLFALQYFNLSLKIAVLRYLHCFQLLENFIN